MVICMIATGLIFHAQSKVVNPSTTMLIFAYFICAVPHAMALGPIPWFMMSELYPTRIRAKAVAITTTVIWIAGWFAGFIFPIMSGWSERTIGSVGIAFWIFGIVSVLALIFGLTIMPETKGRTLEEIAQSWRK